MTIETDSKPEISSQDIRNILEDIANTEKLIGRHQSGFPDGSMRYYYTIDPLLEGIEIEEMPGNAGDTKDTYACSAEFSRRVAMATAVLDTVVESCGFSAEGESCWSSAPFFIIYTNFPEDIDCIANIKAKARELLAMTTEEREAHEHIVISKFEDNWLPRTLFVKPNQIAEVPKSVVEPGSTPATRMLAIRPVEVTDRAL